MTDVIKTPPSIPGGDVFFLYVFYIFYTFSLLIVSMIFCFPILETE